MDEKFLRMPPPSSPITRGERVLLFCPGNVQEQVDILTHHPFFEMYTPFRIRGNRNADESNSVLMIFEALQGEYGRFFSQTTPLPLMKMLLKISTHDLEMCLQQVRLRLEMMTRLYQGYTFHRGELFLLLYQTLHVLEEQFSLADLPPGCLKQWGQVIEKDAILQEELWHFHVLTSSMQKDFWERNRPALLSQIENRS